MDDLISRAAVLRMLNENYVVYRGEIEKMPAVDAIPVEWLESVRNDADDAGDLEMRDAITGLIDEWHRNEEDYMQECCANCKRWLKLVKYDYSHGGCDHSAVFMNEGQIVWMVGDNPEVGQCEAYIPKEE